MIKSQKRGTQFADNIVANELTFNDIDNDVWTVSDGLGSATLDKTLSFEGKSCLKIDNTDVADDITVTNSSQKTIIDKSGKYDFSLCLLKTQPLFVITGFVNIFKNAAPLDSVAFSIGSLDAYSDINGEWISFFTNKSYVLAASDIITFTFTMTGQASALPNVLLYVDGFHFYSKERLQLEAPIYSRSILDVSKDVKEAFGIYDYNDLNTATTPIPLTLPNTQYELTNDGLGAFTNKTYLLTGVPEIWNVLTNRFVFTDLSLGDRVDIRFDIEVTTSSVNTEISLFLELAEGGSPYQLPLIPNANFKTSGTYKLITFFSSYMGDSNTLDNAGRVLIESDSTGVTVKVNGWYISPMKRLI
jgi:hypothetical protein